MLLGPDVQDMDKHSTVDYAGYHLKADGYIPRGQSYFDPEGNGGSLNNKILIFLPGEAIRRVGQTEKSTALLSMTWTVDSQNRSGAFLLFPQFTSLEPLPLCLSRLSCFRQQALKH